MVGLGRGGGRVGSDEHYRRGPPQGHVHGRPPFALHPAAHAAP